MHIPVAKEFMTVRLVTLRPKMDIYEAMDILLKNGISGAPVVDENKTLIGILSERDCLKLFANGALHSVTNGIVEKYMSTDLHTIEPDTGLFTIAELFLKGGFKRLPVVHGGQILGQVSRCDVLLAAREVLERPPITIPWTDSKYIPEQVEALLRSKKPGMPASP